ncbi:MAG: AMIN domain-containing protein, partial [Alphaproteobacteria bacterium]|nr:AMIN domain-containing protein [Alphaproteobacteria bacterium]
MKNKLESAFAGCVSRRTCLKIAGGGMLAITFLPRIAFAAPNSIKSIRTGVQPGDKTRLVIETDLRVSYSLSYPKPANGSMQLVVDLANTGGSASPTLASGTLIKSITTAQSGTSTRIV